MCRPLTDGEIRSRSDDELEADLVETQRARGALEVRRAGLLAEVERRRLHERSGHVSATAWMADRFRLGWGRAARSMGLARSLQDMPATREALADGDLSESALDLLVDARESAPEAFRSSESSLVAAARRLPARGLRREVARWRLATEAPASAAERTLARRRLAVWPTVLGMVRVDGELDPETGQSLISALAAAEGHPAAGDDRSADQRRADALGEICRGWLSGGGRSGVGSSRPTLVVNVDLAALQEDGMGSASFEDAGPISIDLARLLACDASLVRVLTRGRSDVLDVGRKTPIVSQAIRRALVVRDGGCAFPGCDRSPAWTDAHHVRHWVRGGRTALQNLVLLCRRHHRAIHLEGFRVEIADGQPRFQAPDGHPLGNRAPPMTLPA